jgi:hypothetical protein
LGSPYFLFMVLYYSFSDCTLLSRVLNFDVNTVVYTKTELNNKYSLSSVIKLHPIFSNLPIGSRNSQRSTNKTVQPNQRNGNEPRKKKEVPVERENTYLVKSTQRRRRSRRSQCDPTKKNEGSGNSIIRE